MKAPDIDFVAVEAIELPLRDGKSITVRPAKVGVLAAMLRQSGPLIEELALLPPGLLGRLSAPTVDDLIDLMQLLGRQADGGIGIVAAASGQSIDWVRELEADEFGMLFALLVQVNADFFSRAAPAFQAAGRAMQSTADASLPGVKAKAPARGPAPSTR